MGLSLSAFLNYIQIALKSIVSYKRRSLSIGAGMVLGAAIFSSIFFYGSIVKTIAIMDVVNNIEAEVTFMPYGVGFTNPITVAEDIKNEPEVADTTVIYGWGGQPIDKKDEQIVTFELMANVSKTDFEPYFIEPKMVHEDYVNSSIIQSIQISEGKIDLSTGSCLISESMYRTYGIEVGDVLPLNLTSAICTIDYDTYRYNITESYTALMNLTVRGLFRSSSNSYFSSNDIIFSSSNANSDLIENLNEYGYFVIATKLDYDNLPIDDANELSDSIDIMIQRIKRRYPNQIDGINHVGFLIMMNTVQIVLMQIIDFVLYIPAIILSIILINFGADLALQERKYEVAVLKAQGASPKQVRRMIFTEVLIIGLIGEAIGIGLGTIGASVVVSSFSFMAIDLSQFGQAYSFLKIKPAAVIITMIFTLGILLLTTNKKSKAFIKQEVAVVKEIDKPRDGFFKRIYFDVFAFGAAILGIIFAFAREINPEIGLQGWTIFLQILSPLILWYASGLVASRIAPKIPQFLDKYIVKTYKDIGLLIKGSLGRRHQHFPKITLLLCLSVSLAVFTSIQGETGSAHLIREVDTDVGGDMRLELGTGVKSLSLSNFTGFEDKIESIVSFYYAKVDLEWGGNVYIFGVNLTEYAKHCLWHTDSIEGYKDPEDAFAVLLENPYEYVAVDYDTSRWLEIETNSTFGIRLSEDKIVRVNAKLIIDHAPALSNIDGGWGYKLLVDYRFLLKNFKGATSVVRAVVNLKPGVDPDEGNLPLQLKNQFDWINEIRTYDDVLEDYRAAEGRNFGIPGLLSINYIVALVTSIIGVFIFMMLIINRRRKEFAILIAEGASKRQLIKLVISEILSLAIFSTIFGSIIGFFFAYQFNGFISFFDTVFGFSTLDFKRKLTIPITTLIITIVSSFVAIIIATLIPAITASRVKVVEEMRAV
ncbi:MAG: ABC transporter permease [Candidatus Heimdallarchaeaceae archaeon]